MSPGGWCVGVIENSEEYCSILKEVLSEEPRVRRIQFWGSGEEFWHDGIADSLDILFVDYRLPHMNGVDLIRLINEKAPELPKVMLTAAANDQMIFHALQAGAVGFILKAELDDLIKTMVQIIEGGSVISPSIARKVLVAFRPPAREDPGLTKRERQVLKELVAGSSYAATSELLGIAPGTLKVHIRSIYRKLNIKNQIEMTRKAYELGLGPG